MSIAVVRKLYRTRCDRIWLALKVLRRSEMSLNLGMRVNTFSKGKWYPLWIYISDGEKICTSFWCKKFENYYKIVFWIEILLVNILISKLLLIISFSDKMMDFSKISLRQRINDICDGSTLYVPMKQLNCYFIYFLLYFFFCK